MSSNKSERKKLKEEDGYKIECRLNLGRGGDGGGGGGVERVNFIFTENWRYKVTGRRGDKIIEFL